MVRAKEFVCYVVDVGAHMHPHLEAVQRFLLTSAEGKLVHAPRDEVALVLFGSTETRNEPNQEFEAQGSPGQFLHVEVARNFTAPHSSMLDAFATLPAGTGSSDWMDALVVVGDMLAKAGKERVMGKGARRVVLVSNFRGKGQDFDDDFTSGVTTALADHGATLEVVVLDLPEPAPDAALDAIKAANLDQLVNKVLPPTGSQEPAHVCSAGELMATIRFHEVSPTATYKHVLAFGAGLHVPVRAFKKVAGEKLPSLKDFHVAMPEGGTNQVERSRVFKPAAGGGAVVGEGEGEGEDWEGGAGPAIGTIEVPVDDTVVAFRYGSQPIPVDDVDKDFMKYSVTDKQMALISCVKRHEVARYTYLGDPMVVVADKDVGWAGPAVAALVRGMAKEEMVAVVRYVWRNNMPPKVLALVPQPGSGRTADCWVAWQLPFEQDCKWVTFPALNNATRPETLPTEEQVSAFEALVTAWDLGAGGPNGREVAAPEVTPNPVIARFWEAVGRRVLDPQSEVLKGEADPLVAHVLQPPPGPLARAEAARKRVAEVVRVEEVVPSSAGPDAKRLRSAFGQDAEMEEAEEAGAGGEGAAGRVGAGASASDAQAGQDSARPRVTHVGMVDPVSDFNAMCGEGVASRVEEAMAGLREVVVGLLARSAYDTVAKCLAAMSAQAMQRHAPGPFNALLQELSRTCAPPSPHAPFLGRLARARITLLTQDDCNPAHSGSGVHTSGVGVGAVSRGEAAAFLESLERADAVTTDGVGAAAAGGAQEEDDEFADME